jgi:hypothetical protein
LDVVSAQVSGALLVVIARINLGKTRYETKKTSGPLLSLVPNKTKMSSKSLLPVRSAALSRDTNETKIHLAINLDGGEFPADTDKALLKGVDGHASQASKSQTIAINSGIGFLDHMLHALAKHAGWSLALNCKGDLHSTSCKLQSIALGLWSQS